MPGAEAVMGGGQAEGPTWARAVTAGRRKEAEPWLPGAPPGSGWVVDDTSWVGAGGGREARVSSPLGQDRWALLSPPVPAGDGNPWC